MAPLRLQRDGFNIMLINKNRSFVPDNLGRITFMSLTLF